MVQFAHRSLVFFDKNGQQYNLPMVSEVHSGKIYLPEVSTNLIENNTIYILSKYLIDGTSTVGYPKTNSNQIIIKFAKKDSIFSIFSVDINQIKPTITTYDELIINLATPTDDYLINDDNQVGFDGVNPLVFIQDAINFNYMAKSEVEGMYENQILIYAANNGVLGNLLAAIDVNVAIVDEDERLTTILSNFGETIDDETFKIFADTDINDAFHDNIVLNKRMKELIVEFGNIFPHTSSLRGLTNILKFLGYSDMRVKEYWLDTISGKFVKRQVGMDSYNPDQKVTILRKPYRKLPYFGLYYDINRPTGEYDNKGLPQMEDDLFFTKDEIIVKLFGLKKYIEDKNIGGIAKIKDIIGEANLYHEAAYYHSMENSELISELNNNFDLKPKVVITKNSGYIHDLRPELYNPSVQVCLLPRNIVSESIPEQAYVHYNCILGNFDGGYGLPIGADLFFEDNYEIPVGFLLELENKTFDLPIGQITTTFADLGTFPISVTLANLGSINYYKIKWEIVRQNNDGRPYYSSFEGKITESSRYFRTILPYEGQYSVKMTLFGYGNNNIYYEYNFVEVKLQNIDFTGFHQEYSRKNNQLGSISTPIGEMKTKFKDTIFSTNPPVPERVEFRSYDLARYMDLNQFGNINIGVRESYPLGRIDAIFADMGHMRIRDFGYQKQRMPDFNITKVYPGGKISINGTIFTIPSTININDFAVLAAAIQNAFEDYLVTYRFADNFPDKKFIDIRQDIEEIWAGSNNGDDISCIEKNYRTLGEMDVPIGEVNVPFATTNVLCRVKRRENPFNAGNVFLSQNTLEIHRFSVIFFQDDISPALGRKAHSWSVWSEDDGEFIAQNITYKYFNFRFENIGFYSIILNLKDTNGNDYSVTKKNFIKVIN